MKKALMYVLKLFIYFITVLPIWWFLFPNIIDEGFFGAISFFCFVIVSAVFWNSIDKSIDKVMLC